MEDFRYNENDPVNKMFDRLPFVLDRVEYKGETIVAQINYEASKKAGKPMLDISYCLIFNNHNYKTNGRFNYSTDIHF